MCIRDSICSTVTKVAMTVMYAGRRTLSGMILRRAEMAMFEQIRTNVAATPMPRPLTARVVTARVAVSYTHLDVYKRQDVDFDLFEAKDPAKASLLVEKGFFPAGKPMLLSSDAHRMEDVACRMCEIDEDSPLMQLLKK